MLSLGQFQSGFERKLRRFTVDNPACRASQNEVNADALFGIQDRLNRPANGQGFFDPNPARATPRWNPLPFLNLSPPGRGDKQSV
jgi:hypothetical protein